MKFIVIEFPRERVMPKGWYMSLSMQRRRTLRRRDRRQLCKERKTYEAQEQFILENFGEEAAGNANYGWTVDEVENCICTKVYGYGVLTTDMTTKEHEFEPWD